MGTANATQEKASEFVLIRILGKEHAWSDHKNYLVDQHFTSRDFKRASDTALS